MAAPYTPETDDQVLQRLPTPSILDGADALQEKLADDPRDRDSAEQLARLYIQAARREGDPRYLGYASATLSPWLQGSDAPPSVLVLAATIAQGEHRFTQARHQLREALAQNPRLGQGWLTLAVITQVQGQYEESLQACRRAATLVPTAAALTCQASVLALNGGLEPAYARLSRYADGAGDVADNVAVWMQTRLAEMAWQKGDLDAARAHIQRGRALDPEDRYLRHLYADFLLAESRPDAAIDVLEDYVDQDGALLRLAIAGIDAGDRRADRWAQQFRDRMAAAQRSAEYAHLRELARFTLVVEDDPAEALALARANWRTQKEPADMHIYLAAARAAGEPGAADEVRTFIAEHGVQDSRLAPFLDNGTEAGP
ncbi:MAG: tetratricopeptide repeat protein [Alcanivorax sp.]|nr:tetratricopeptide repeat protein [Alcanivorax sp.]